MKIPIVKYSDKFLNSISWFMKIGGVTLFPFIILREIYNTSDYKNLAKKVINHESIHIKQQQEMLVIPFYLWYGIEWFIKLFIYGSKAYNNLSFEREAHVNENNPNYIIERKFWAWIKYL
mgnify:CR=1 FL=1|tara:strand:+ start:14487 stop:14846 length:360 start_codon:yes stop_codon:yes gene_type:complete